MYQEGDGLSNTSAVSASPPSTSTLRHPLHPSASVSGLECTIPSHGSAGNASQAGNTYLQAGNAPPNATPNIPMNVSHTPQMGNAPPSGLRNATPTTLASAFNGVMHIGVAVANFGQPGGLSGSSNMAGSAGGSVGAGMGVGGGMGVGVGGGSLREGKETPTKAAQSPRSRANSAPNAFQNEWEALVIQLRSQAELIHQLQADCTLLKVSPC